MVDIQFQHMQRSKGGVAQVTKALCNEWAEKGINVNALAPGYMATEMNTALLDPSNPRNAKNYKPYS